MNFLKLIRPFDIIIVVLLLALAAGLALKGFRFKSKRYVVITREGNTEGEYPLDKDRLIKLDHNIVVEIKDNKVRVKSSPCRNQICVKQGWSSSQPIICAPEKLSVVIKSEDSEEEMLISH